MKTIQVPAQASPLVCVLVQIVMDPRASGDTVVSAAELIAIDVRFNQWVLRFAKPNLSRSALEELVAIADDVDSAVEAAWSNCQNDELLSGMSEALEIALSKLREAQHRTWPHV